MIIEVEVIKLINKIINYNYLTEKEKKEIDIIAIYLNEKKFVIKEGEIKLIDK